MRRVSVLVALLAAAGIAGCKGSDSTSTSVSAPGPSTLAPTGTIQGRLTDRVTQQPIVGAVLSIGLSAAGTDANGQFVLPNVPATVDQVNGHVSGDYYVTIDLQRVSSPVAMGANPAIAYPKFAYKRVYVEYTSLDDTNGTTPGAGSGSNHDTPVVGLVAGFDLSVAKLAAGFKGVVLGCVGSPYENAPVVAPSPETPYIVRLLAPSSDNSASGANGHVVTTTPVLMDGTFAFSTIESLGTFQFESVDPAGKYYGLTGTSSAPADGQTQAGIVVHVCPTDTVGPYVTAITPEPGADVSPATTTVVTFTFSEPVLQGAATATTPGIPGDLFSRIEVWYGGQKAGDLAYQLAWNAAFTQLSVSFATAPSGKYWVRLPPLSGFTDSYLNPATLGVCPDDSDPRAATYGVAALGQADNCTAFFSTSGAPIADAPASLNIVNRNQINWSGAPLLDWVPALGAKNYSVYRTCYQWPGYPVPASGAMTGTAPEPGPEVLLGVVAVTEYQDANLSFIEGDNIPLACTYKVKGISSDWKESAGSVSANASDVVAPTLTSAVFQDPAGLVTLYSPATPNELAADRVRITFNEDMDEKVVEAATYTIGVRPGFAAPTVAKVDYVNKVATISFASVLDWAIVPADGYLCPAIAQANLGGDDQRVQYMYTDTNFTPLPTCVAAFDINGALIAVTAQLAAGDVCCNGAAGPACGAAGICAGPDGVCQSSAANPDRQQTPLNGFVRCISAGTNGALETAHGAGVFLNAVQSVTAGNALKDVAGNPINPQNDRVLTRPLRNGGGALIQYTTD